MDVHKLFAKVVNVLKEHASFLDATEKNLSYFLIGKKANITSSSTFPTLDLINFFSTYVNVAESHNVLSYLVGNFMEEISNTNFVLNITPYPVRQEPFLSFCDVLEDYIFKIHRDNKRKNLIKGMVLELFAHGYVGFYSDGIHYYPLSAFDLIPGDPSIKEIQDQPFVVRRTKILVADLLNNKYAIPESLNDSLKRRDPLSYCNLYDVWVKSEDLNVVFTDDGKVLYQQKFPYPKIYPFFVANDANLVNYFYTVPLMSLLAPLQDKYVESIQNLEDSSKSISKPLLVYDTDAGIDENKLLYALKKGYKQIIVEKNREGNIQFLAPGYLPNYATELPMFILNELMHQVGISEAFLGMAPGSVRERGAMSSLISASFRRVYSKASLLETLFSDLDFYLIEYLREHKLKIKFPFEHSEEILTYNTFFIPDEHFYGFGSEDSTNSQVLTLRKWQQKLISQKQALSELGYQKPSRILKDQLSENELMTKSMQRLQSQIQAKPRTPLEEIAHRLRVSHIKDFYLKPISDDKVLINCKDKDKSQISFLLSDLSNNFLIESSKKIFNATIAQPRETSQEELDKISQQGKEIENTFSELNQAQGENPQQTQSNSSVSGETVEVPSQKKTRGRPKEKIIPEKEVELKKPTPRNLGEAPEDQTKSEKDSLQPRNSIQEEQKEENSLSEEQIVIMMSELLRKSQTSIKDHKRYLDLPGLYLVEPHASWIYDGKKTMIIKSKKYDVENKSYLLCGDLVYGVIIFHRVLPCSPQMFKDFQKYHFISDKEVEKWGWKDKPLYLYLFEFHKFIKPLNYKKESGVQTFIKKVEIIKNPKLEFGVPQTGDLKPMEIKPWKVPPPHKPEKKALQPQEVFSAKRLKDILPEGTWDVSSKWDGLRLRIWKVGNKAKGYSDQGNEFKAERIKPILDDVIKYFPVDVLLDGELIMESTERKDIAGYIHSEAKPTPDELASLRYYVWDILYVKDQSIASKPFQTRSSVLDLYLRGRKGRIIRVKHIVVPRDKVPEAVKQVTSKEGAFIREIHASYWATHLSFKVKWVYDLDCKVVAVEQTKLGLPIFHCVLRDGTYIGQTYAQAEVKAKPGDVIRVNVNHITLRPDGSIGWFAPRPKSFKEGKISPNRPSLTQVGIGGPDSLDLVKEIYFASGGTEKKWKDWYPKHLDWKKNTMPKLLSEIKRKIREGIPSSKT